MSPTTKSPAPAITPQLRRISLNPSHFRVGRWFLLAEGILLVGLGTAGLDSVAMSPSVGPTGAALLGLALTPAHCAVLTGLGVAAVSASLHRRAAVVVTATSTVAFVLLFAIGSVASARATPGLFGFDPRDSALHAVLLAYNLALLMWLIPDALEGPAWIRRRKRPQNGMRPDPLRC